MKGDRETAANSQLLTKWSHDECQRTVSAATESTLKLFQDRQQPAISSPSKKPVHFNKRVRLHFIPYLSQDEFESCWYSREDEKKFQKDIKKSVISRRRSAASNDKSSPEDCFRGLEHLSSPSAFKKCIEEKSNAIDAILDAQDEDADKDFISKVSREVSQNAKDRARLLAICDALEAAA